jgi:hypothetical protein
VGQSLELGGYLYARDFPEIVEEIAKSRRTNDRKSFDTLRDKQARVGTIHGVSDREPRAETGGSRLRASLRVAVRQILSLSTLSKEASEKRKTQAASVASIRAESSVAAGASGLGLSYEVTDVQIADPRHDVWALTKVTFTGAAILRKDKAAYRDTWIELSS